MFEVENAFTDKIHMVMASHVVQVIQHESTEGSWLVLSDGSLVPVEMDVKELGLLVARSKEKKSRKKPFRKELGGAGPGGLTL